MGRGCFLSRVASLVPAHCLQIHVSLYPSQVRHIDSVRASQTPSHCLGGSFPTEVVLKPTRRDQIQSFQAREDRAAEAQADTQESECGR